MKFILYLILIFSSLNIKGQDLYFSLAIQGSYGILVESPDIVWFKRNFQSSGGQGMSLSITHSYNDKIKLSTGIGIDIEKYDLRDTFSKFEYQSDNTVEGDFGGFSIVSRTVILQESNQTIHLTFVPLRGAFFLSKKWSIELGTTIQVLLRSHRSYTFHLERRDDNQIKQKSDTSKDDFDKVKYNFLAGIAFNLKDNVSIFGAYHHTVKGMSFKTYRSFKVGINQICLGLRYDFL